jgi:hypothetical protein
MSWKKFNSLGFACAKVEGDPDVRPTTLLNWFFMKRWGWKTVQILEVSKEAAFAGYRLGYRPAFGQARLQSNELTHLAFKVLIGHEPCDFFAVDKGGKEIPLKLGARTAKKDPKYAIFPLL